MARIRGKDTGPEIAVRKALHAAGFRFRLHRRDLPGTPDIVLPALRTAVFVHGCFWHRHEGCRNATVPGTRTGFWLAKFTANAERDAKNGAALEALGWKVVVIWECETHRADRLADVIRARLPAPGALRRPPGSSGNPSATPPAEW
ncbi:very short patch repair endonuclease [Paracoccus sp. SMMA_5_TC]|nr:very short patch repair endonuclease [Paracoccus sp. SMMA_5]UXU82163.1 very short patch repair endonuclease [Paracoccus sp. SMMA_5_TC]